MKHILVLLSMCVFLPQFVAAAEKAPDFSVKRAAGEVNLYSLLKKNTVVMIFFGKDSSASWKKLSDVDALAAEYRYRGSGFELITLVAGKSPAELAALKESHWVNVDLFPDAGGKIARSFQVNDYPSVVIVDPFGAVQFLGMATNNQLREKLNAFVDKPVEKAFCPVDKMWVVVTDKTPAAVYKNKRYYFCTPDDHGGQRMDQDFLKDPERYLSAQNPGAVEPKQTQKPPLVYVCPMHSDVRQGAPGLCPKCGMELKKEN